MSNQCLEKVSRNIHEFEHILKDLLEFGYANVESSLGGSGSSRHHPETIYLTFLI